MAVMDDVGREQRDTRSRRGVPMAIEFIADQAIIDEQQRPSVMCVLRIHVTAPLGMQHLGGWNLAVGFGFIVSGLGMATQWK